MEFFYPISFGFQSNFGQYISMCNNFYKPKYQVPLGMSIEKNLTLIKWLNL
jgi:hypothetical protein